MRARVCVSGVLKNLLIGMECVALKAVLLVGDSAVFACSFCGTTTDCTWWLFSIAKHHLDRLCKSGVHTKLCKNNTSC